MDMAPFTRPHPRLDSRPKPRTGFPTTRLHEKNPQPAESRDRRREEIRSQSEDDDVAADAGLPAYSLLLRSLRNHPRDETTLKRKKRRMTTRDDPEHEEAVEDERHPSEPARRPGPGNDDSPGLTEDPNSPSTLEAEGAAQEGSTDDEEQNLDPDPLGKHFFDVDEPSLAPTVALVKQDSWDRRLREHTILGKEMRMIPARPGDHHLNDLTYTGPACLKLKQRLAENASAFCSRFGPLERAIAPLMFHHVDLFFPGRTLANADSLRRLACLHMLNHMIKTRDRVTKNNGRLARHQAAQELELRDQGFTRPKVLVLLPTRQSCAEYVDTLVDLFRPDQQENKKRFQDSFVRETNDVSESKPDDFRDLFGGNDDDMFRIGLRFTRKTIRFFSPFYGSDLIIASPLGLYTAITSHTLAPDPHPPSSRRGTSSLTTTTTTTTTTRSGPKHDHDFLSSIELAVVDRADALLMQNWDHVEYIFDHLNQAPTESHGCDYGRIRLWYLDGHAPYLRQTVLLSAFNTSDLNGLFFHRMKNVSGKVRWTPRSDGAILGLGTRLKQIFVRFDSASPMADPDARFKCFCTTVVPSLVDTAGTLIFLPSYFDFVRVRNFFSTSPSTQNISFGAISEYTPVREASRARSHFLSGRHAVLLYTERAHHFRRYHLRGVTRVIMYGVCDHPAFYREIVAGYLEASLRDGKLKSGAASSKCLYSKWDALSLERIVGTDRVASLLKDDTGDVFEFV